MGLKAQYLLELYAVSQEILVECAGSGILFLWWIILINLVMNPSVIWSVYFYILHDK